MTPFCYIAYPTSLTLKSANAIQTWSTLRELRALEPHTLALIPRWRREPTRFDDVGAVHLPRPAIGKLSRLYHSTLWYYAERSAFAAMCAAEIVRRRRNGQQIAAVYVREVICAAWWAAVYGPQLGLPVVYEAHDLESWNPSRAKERWAQPLLNLVDRVALTRSTRVASLTDAFRGVLAQIDWRAPHDVDIIPDAYDPHLYYDRDQAGCRAALGIAPGTQLVVYSGMSFAYRGLERLVDALAALVPQHPDLRAVLVGGRPAEVAALVAQAAALGIGERVTFTGQIAQEQTTQYLGAADLLVIPDTVTDVTASPLKLFEYMASARAIILPAIPALAEILPAHAGWYFTRGNTAALTTTLAAALADPTARTQRAQSAARLVQQHTYAARARRVIDSVRASMNTQMVL